MVLVPCDIGGLRPLHKTMLKTLIIAFVLLLVLNLGSFGLLLGSVSSYSAIARRSSTLAVSRVVFIVLFVIVFVYSGNTVDHRLSGFSSQFAFQKVLLLEFIAVWVQIVD